MIEEKDIFLGDLRDAVRENDAKGFKEKLDGSPHLVRYIFIADNDEDLDNDEEPDNDEKASPNLLNLSVELNCPEVFTVLWDELVKLYGSGPLDDDQLKSITNDFKKIVDATGHLHFFLYVLSSRKAAYLMRFTWSYSLGLIDKKRVRYYIELLNHATVGAFLVSEGESLRPEVPNVLWPLIGKHVESQSYNEILDNTVDGKLARAIQLCAQRTDFSQAEVEKMLFAVFNFMDSSNDRPASRLWDALIAYASESNRQNRRALDETLASYGLSYSICDREIVELLRIAMEIIIGFIVVLGTIILAEYSLWYYACPLGAIFSFYVYNKWTSIDNQPGSFYRRHIASKIDEMINKVKDGSDSKPRMMMSSLIRNSSVCSSNSLTGFDDETVLVEDTLQARSCSG